MDQQDTKTKLLLAAVKIFSLYGYEGATTRMITGEINANISAIPYYFGNKEGIYEAVLLYLFKDTHTFINEQIVPISQVLTENKPSREAYNQALNQLVERFAYFLIKKQTNQAISVIIREQAEPSELFTRLYMQFLKLYMETLTLVVSNLIAKTLNPDKAIIITHTIIGQMLVFRTHKTLLLHRLEIQDYDEPTVARIIKILVKQTNYMVNLWIEE